MLIGPEDQVRSQALKKLVGGINAWAEEVDTTMAKY
jgi:hypothetical protein